MKKLLSLALAFVLAFSLVGCNKDTPASGGNTGGTFEYALVTDYGNIDDQSFNQHSWMGLEQFALEVGGTHTHYRPVEESTDGYVTSIEMAIDNGARIVVLPGFSFADPTATVQERYPEVKFILIDAVPTGGAAENTYAIIFAEEQSGFLAGYAAVMDGYRKLGFIGGMAVPAVIRYGYGYVQGAEYAAAELGLPAGSIEIMYAYAGTFEASPDIQSMAAAWYQNGTEVIFSCGGAIINSIIAAAEASEDKYVIGVDSDQSYQSETVITSALKELQFSVYTALKLDEAGEFPGGVVVTLGAAEDSIGLPMETSRFNTFTQEDYDAVYELLKTDADGLATDMLKDSTEDGTPITIAGLNATLTYVVVTDAN
jgi:Uncharacterized ABC-type transport system, periplasmic component/surface lipoprotein